MTFTRLLHCFSFALKPSPTNSNKNFQIFDLMKRFELCFFSLYFALSHRASLWRNFQQLTLKCGNEKRGKVWASQHMLAVKLNFTYFQWDFFCVCSCLKSGELLMNVFPVLSIKTEFHAWGRKQHSVKWLLASFFIGNWRFYDFFIRQSP